MLYENSPNTELSKIKKEYKEKKIDRQAYITLKSKVTYFGYTNERKFLYAIGKPIAMLFFSFILFYASSYIDIKNIKRNIQIASFLSCGISFYFLFWAFWYRADLPEYIYYSAIGICSLASSMMVYLVTERKRIARIKLEKREAESERFENTAMNFINEVNQSIINC